jgi:hypothetical protein
MGTPTLRQPSSRGKLLAQIYRLKHVALDWEIAVDDARAELDRAVHNRDGAVRHLAYLVDVYDEIEAVADTFGPEIAEAHATILLDGTAA